MHCYRALFRPFLRFTVSASYSSAQKAHTITRKSVVPSEPAKVSFGELPPRTVLDEPTVELLERLSLVKFDNQEGKQVLEDAIAFADKVLSIDTDNVEPLYTVLEEGNLYMRQDEVTEGNCQKDILANAELIEEEYFVSPPGNIPLHSANKLEDTDPKRRDNLIQECKA